MTKVSNYKSGAIYKTAQGLYIYKDEETQSESYSTISDLVMLLQSNENNQVSRTSQRSAGYNSESETKKKPRKKTARKTK